MLDPVIGARLRSEGFDAKPRSSCSADAGRPRTADSGRGSRCSRLGEVVGDGFATGLGVGGGPRQPAKLGPGWTVLHPFQSESVALISIPLSTTLQNQAKTTLETRPPRPDWVGDLLGRLGVDQAACRGRCSAVRQVARDLGIARDTVAAAVRSDRPPKYERPAQTRRRSRRSRRESGRCWRSIRRCR